MNVSLIRWTKPLVLLVLVGAACGTLSAQDCIALYQFNNNLQPTPVNGEVSVSNLTVPFGNTMFWNGAGNPAPLFCLLSAWRTTTEQSPANGSQRYFEFTITPLNGCTLDYASLCMDFIAYSGGTTVDKFAVYADEVPGSGGDNFETKIAQASNIVNGSLNNVCVSLSGASFLQGVAGPVTFRIYWWSSNSGTSSSSGAETMVDNLQVCATVNPPAPQPAKIGDYVWLDLDEDGAQDGNEPGVPGVQVVLLDGSNQPTGMSMLTDNDGLYLFCVDAGSYRVQWVLPPGYRFTTVDASSGSLDSDADPVTGRSTNVTTVAAGEQKLNQDAGLVVDQAKIGNRVWIDADCDGIQDGNELGLAGAQVDLYDLGSATPNVPVATTTTANDGTYEFCVEAGTYRVGFVTPVGYVVTDATVGSDGLIDSDAPLGDLIAAPISVVAGETRHDLDAGFCVCAGLQAVAVPLGPSCFQLLDPVLSATQPVLGTQTTVTVTSAFPNALVLPFFSLAPVTPIQIGNTGCTVYVDAFNPGNLFMPGTGYTDANGHWEMTFILPNDPMLAGLAVIFQVRLCAPNGPAGPLAPDWSTNGLFVRLGCP